jgi:hypothetical protein
MAYRKPAKELITNGLYKIECAEKCYDEDSVEYDKIQRIRRDFGLVSTAATTTGSESAFEDLKEYFDGLEGLLETVGDSE